MPYIVDEYDAAHYFLTKIGAPISDQTINAFIAWKRQESGHQILRNQPLNLTYVQGMPGYQGLSGAFAQFDTYQHGLDATVYFLEVFGNDWRGYGEILKAFRSGNALRILQVIAQSAWDEARYGTSHGGPNHLIAVYNAIHGDLIDTVYPGPIGTIPHVNPAYIPPAPKEPPVALDRISVLKNAIAEQNHNVAVNLSVGKTVEAAIDQATADKYVAELIGLLAEQAAASVPPIVPPADVPPIVPPVEVPPTNVPPVNAPSGLTNWGAAQIDAGFVFQASRGNTDGADTNPAPGAAKLLGFSGVVGTSTSSGFVYGIFRDGVLTSSVDAPPATGWDFTFGLYASINPDDPYTGPGRVQ